MYNKDLSKIEEGLLLLLKAFSKASYERNFKEYLFEVQGKENCKIAVNEEAIDFKITVTKWIRGSYEPIESSEIYKSIKYDELEGLSQEEKINIIVSTFDMI